MALTLPDDNEIDRMGKADVALAKMIGHGINTLIEKHQLDRSQIKAIGSHGQTIRHRPEHGFTLQLAIPTSLLKSLRFRLFQISVVEIWQQAVRARHWFQLSIKHYFNIKYSSCNFEFGWYC